MEVLLIDVEAFNTKHFGAVTSISKSGDTYTIVDSVAGTNTYSTKKFKLAILW